MKFIVGLGNPGQKYRNTRHNMGYMVVEEIARRYAIDKEECKFDSIIGHIRINGEKVLVVKPLTFMNLSGKAVQALMRFYKQELSELIVIYDDMDLETGRIRVRADGGSGGHKGISSINERLGSQEFPRVRIGIGRPPEHWSVEAWVLSETQADEKADIETAVKKASDAVICWVKEGIVQAMNQYN
ncbi:peptidyl-trna hydrolase [hydrocarbon metagenome]|uniref:peptidyl-tRNA hydrolase n=1 Tax=hydrocarbon metagenome TaxID=938273 RepID=A0A0W8E9C8_9ZZZZ